MHNYSEHKQIDRNIRISSHNRSFSAEGYLMMKKYSRVESFSGWFQLMNLEIRFISRTLALLRNTRLRILYKISSERNET